VPEGSDYPSLGAIEKIEIDDREDGHGGEKRSPFPRAPTLDGIDPEETGQCRILCRHMATTLLEATIVELLDLRQNVLFCLS